MDRDPPADPKLVEAFLRRRAPLHLYELGDLDEPFVGLTTFLVERGESGEPAAVALLYRGSEPPTLLALAGDDRERAALERLLERVTPALPARVYAHLTPSLAAPLSARWAFEPRGEHVKLVWSARGRLDDPRDDRGWLADPPGADVLRLGPPDADEIRAFLDRVYPEHFFHPRVLGGSMAFGVRRAGALVAFAGVHVFAPARRVAALGNVATDPELRGQGLATRTCAALCRALAPHADVIGLNVEASNAAARRCYDKLGFSFVAPYVEAVLSRRS